ncbi:MAG: TldD/PmbA family protein [Nanoarchaeota archaeon]|nr:TldD/PmbA family protein [Nanoarchaeota archaeon]
MEEILRKVVNQSKNVFVEAEISCSSGEALVFEKKKLLYPQIFDGDSLTVRVTFPDGRAGVSSTSHINHAINCLNEAKKFAKVSVPDKQFQCLPIIKKSNKLVKLFDNNVKDYTAEDLWNDANAMISFSEEKGVNVQMLSSSKSVGKTFFMNSEGCAFNEEIHIVSGGISVVKNKFSGDEAQVFTRKPDFLSIAENAVSNCLSSQNPVKIKSGSTPMILCYDAFNSLSESVLFNAVNGYSVFKKKSFLAGKLGEHVFSDKLTIIDNPVLDYGLGSRIYDSEGALSVKKTLISKGVVTDFLQDNYTNLVRGEGTNGNCSSINSRPSISPSNLVVKKGSISYEDMLSQAEGALLVKEIGGAHMINAISGDFSNEATKAFIVKNGDLVPVKNVMIAGNFFELLNDLELVGNDYKQKSAIMAPTLLFSKVQAVA